MMHKLRVVFPEIPEKQSRKTKKPVVRKNPGIVLSAKLAVQWGQRINSSINALSAKRGRFIARSKKMDPEKRQKVLGEYNKQISLLKKFLGKLRGNINKDLVSNSAKRKLFSDAVFRKIR